VVGGSGREAASESLVVSVVCGSAGSGEASFVGEGERDDSGRSSSVGGKNSLKKRCYISHELNRGRGIEIME
jgi:hypothetical protein